MFHRIWNFFRGYVKINIVGFSCERLISQAALERVVFWDIEREGGVTNAKVSLNDLKKLEKIAIKTKTEIKQTGHFGFYVVCLRLKKRLALGIGAAFFVMGLIALTSFVWQVDIQGTNRLKSEEILEFLAQNGFASGTFRHGLAYREIENKLMAHFSDIAWVSVNIRGTKANISIVETTLPPPLVDFSIPANIVAAKDGLLLEMATSAGTPLFKPGDVVRAGDVLVSGRLAIGAPGEEISYEYVRASSEIWARLYYRMNFEIPLVFFEKSFTERTKKVYSIIIGQKEFFLPHTRHNFIYYDTTEDLNPLAFGENYPLPFTFVVTNYKELSRHEKKRNFDSAKALGEEMVHSLIAQQLSDDSKLISKEISFTETIDSVIVEVFVIANERIDRVVEIELTPQIQN